MKPAHFIILLLMNFCWAAVFSAYKVVGHDLPSGSIVTLRFGLGALCLLCAWPWLRGPAPRGGNLARTCLLGLLVFVLGQRLQAYGNQLATAGNSAVLMTIEPLMTSIAAAIFLRESIGIRRAAGFALSLVGVALLNEVWREDFHWVGLVPSLVFISGFVCEAAYSVMGKPIVATANAVKMLTIALLVATAANLLIDGAATFGCARTLPPRSWGVLLGLSVVCTSIGYSVWLVVIRDCPVNLAALTIFVQSVFGMAIAAVWVGEKLHWGHILGSVTIIAGLVVGLSGQIQKPPAQSGSVAHQRRRSISTI